MVNETAEKKTLAVYVPSPKDDILYPGLESVQKHNTNNSFNFEGVVPEISQNISQTNAFNFDSVVQDKTVEIPRTNTFNFESQQDPFKEIAEKKGDDMFKNSDFGNDADWDFQ